MSNITCLDCGHVHKCGGVPVTTVVMPILPTSGSWTANPTDYTVTQTDGTVAQ